MATTSTSYADSLASTANSLPILLMVRPIQRSKQKVQRPPYQRMRLWNPNHKRRDPIFPPGFEPREEIGENDISEAMLTYQISQLKWIPFKDMLKINNEGEAEGR